MLGAGGGAAGGRTQRGSRPSYALLEKPDVARAMGGEAGYQAVIRRQGGVRATMELVERYLAVGEIGERHGKR